MNCCGSHEHGNEENKYGHDSHHSQNKSSWLRWIIVVSIIALLVFSFIK